MTLTTYFKDKAPRANASSVWLERTNPLKGLSLREAQNIYDLAKNGNFCQLHYIYNEIEAANPVLLTCVERRSSALAGLGWKASASAHATDSELAEKQKRAIAQLAESLDNLDETIEHLALAFFRGFSHVRVVRQADGTPTGFDLLNSWNFAFGKVERQWYWNPNCRLTIPGAGSDMEAVPAGELLTVMRPRAIDYPALAVHIRHALAERDWGRFLERYGIPPVYAIMPQGASEKDRDLFLEGVGKMQNGRGTALPSGSDVKFAQEARGVNPFLEFIKHQEKTIVLLATGGTLTSLAEAGSGTLAGNAQMDVWEQIVERDGVMIGNALDRTIFRPYLQALFPRQPIVAHFELGKETEASPSEILEMGAKAKTAGYRIAKATLEEKTGYTLEEDTPAAQPGFPALNAALNASLRGGNDEAIHKNETKEEPADPDSLSVLQAFAKDATPAAQAVKALIDNPNPAEAEKLLKDLPDLLPRDPAMAAVIAEEMAKAFQLNATQAKNAGTSEGARKGWETRRRNGWSKEMIEQKGAELKTLAEEIFAGSKEQKTVSIGSADGQEVADIQRLLGIDVTGRDHVVRANDLRHAYNRHGPLHRKGQKKVGEKDPNQIPLEPKDFERLPEVYSGYTKLKKGAPDNQTGNPTVIFEKKYPDGTLFAVEMVPEAGALSYKTGYKWKPGYKGKEKPEGTTGR